VPRRLVLEFPDGDELRGDRLLVATGRRPRVEGIGLENVGIEPGPRGIEVDGALATWPRLLAGRAEQREVEPDVARARDLAEAYHYLDYYGGVYEEPEESDEWSPVPLIRRLAAEARELGGDPTLLEPRSQYMRLALDPDSFANQQGEECK